MNIPTHLEVINANGKTHEHASSQCRMMDPALVACTCLDRRSITERPQHGHTEITNLQCERFNLLISRFHPENKRVNIKAWSAPSNANEIERSYRMQSQRTFLAADRISLQTRSWSQSAKCWSIPRRWQINETQSQSSSLRASWRHWGKRTRLCWSAHLGSIPRINELNVEFFTIRTLSTSWTATLHLPNVVHETCRSHCWVIHHLIPPLVQRTPGRHKWLTSNWTLNRGNTRFRQWNIRWSQCHSSVWIHRLLCHRLTSQSLHVWGEGCCWLNSRSTSDGWQNCRGLLLALVMSLDGQSFLLHDRLLFPEQWALTDQMQVAWIWLHCDRRDPRPCTILFLNFHLRRPVCVNTCQLRELQGLIWALHTSHVIPAPSCILDQGWARNTTDHKPWWRNRTAATGHIQTICSTVESEFQPIGILTKSISWRCCHEPQLHMAQRKVERHNDPSFRDSVDPPTDFPGYGTHPPSLENGDHESWNERGLL